MQTPPGFYFVGGVEREKNVPQQQVNLKTSVNLPYDVALDAMLRYVDAVPYYTIPSYVAVDMRLGWKPHKNLELSIVGQNLFDKQHPEFVDGAFQVPQIQIRRSVFGKIGISF